MDYKKEFIFLVLSIVYAGMFIIAPVMSCKIIPLFGLNFAGGLVPMTFAFMVVDLVNNSFGPNMARMMLWGSLIVRSIIFILVIPFVLFLPVVYQPVGFSEMFIQSYRMFIGAEIATFLLQYFVDIPIFAWMTKKRIFRWFGLRYNLSNLVSVSLTTTIVILIGYIGTQVDIYTLLFGQVFMRIAITLITTPFSVVCNRGIQWATR